MKKKTLVIIIVSVILLAIIIAIAIPSIIKQKIASNEGSAAGSLKTLNGMMATYKKKGYYGQGRRYPHGNAPKYKNDGKYCGLFYETENGGGQPVNLIDPGLAGADLRADGDTDITENTGIYFRNNAPVTIIFSSRPKRGYWFGLMMYYEKGEAKFPYDLTNAKDHYGLQAIPAEYGSSGEVTFIINEEGTVFSSDKGKETKYLDTFPNDTRPDLGHECD